MRAKILLLSDEHGDAVIDAAERALTDVAAAFGHTLILLREGLAEQAPDALVNACLAADAVLISDARAAGVSALADALGTALHIRVLHAPEAVAGRGAARLWLTQVESLDDETATVAFETAKAVAAREELAVSHIAPGGKLSADWIARAQKAFGGEYRLTAPDAMTALVEAPASLQLLLTPPAMGAVFRAALTSLAPYPVFLRDLYLGGDVPLFSPVMPKDAPLFSPWGLMQSVADLLRDGLKLHREADCTEAAVHNVLAAGWRTADIAAPGQARVDAEAIADLITEQIELAGELLGKGASFHENPLS